MNSVFRKTLIASAVAALMSSPVWATSDVTEPQVSDILMAEQDFDDAPPAEGDVPEAEDPMGIEAGEQAEIPLSERTPEELKDKRVFDPEGDRAGTVKTIVADHEYENVFAVISVGGFLGIGATEIVVPLDELALGEDDSLQSTVSREELEEREEYVAEQYAELEPDRPIGDVAAREVESEDEIDDEDFEEFDPEEEELEEDDFETDEPEEPEELQ